MLVNVTVENLAACKKLLRIEVEVQQVDETFDRTTLEYQRQVRLPGFRPGKAPRAMVSRSFAKDIEDEVKRRLIGDAYRRALDEQKLRVIGYPDIEEIAFGRGQALQFAATVETAPEFDLPEYKGLPVKIETRSVSDDDVERALKLLAEQRSTYQDVARPVQSGDFVVVNYTGTCDGQPITATAPTARGLTEQKNFWLRIETSHFIPGFTDQLIGAVAKDQRLVNVDFPADFVAPQLSGRKGVYAVEIVQVKERLLPALDDAFAKTYGADNLEALRAGVRTDLENELKHKRDGSIRNQLVGALLGRVQCELPESVVVGETRNVIYDIVRENQQRGISKEDIDSKKEEIYAYAANNARDRVKATFLFGRIAEKEGIKVTQEEISQRIMFLANQYQMRPDKFVKQLQERNGVAEIQEQILSAKVLDFLQLQSATEEVPAVAAPPTPA